MGARGAVLVELLIAYIPVLFCFLAFWQLSELLVAQMVVARASSAAGRAAVVVLPDDPVFYAGEAPNTLGGKREADVRLAAGMILAASPHLAEDFNLYIGNLPEDVGAVDVSVSANFRCDRLRFVCGADGVISLSATSQHTYHGAKYQYEPTDLSAAATGDSLAFGDASCQDGDPASNGTGGKPGKNDDGTGGRGNDGTGGRGGEGSTRGGGDLDCSNEPGSSKRKCREDCPNPDDVKDAVGDCCRALKRVKLENGDPARRCQEPKPQCVNQESANGKNGHKLTGTITADKTTLSLPEIAPDFTEICGDGSKCPATSDEGSVDDIGIKIVANLKLKEKEAWCPKTGGQRKAKAEQLKQEWNEWAQQYKSTWLSSAEARKKISAWKAKNPRKSDAQARSAVWSTKKGQLDRQRDKNAAAGIGPKAGEGNMSSYSGPNPNIQPFFDALDEWCTALEAADGSDPYKKFKDPAVVAAEKVMLEKMKAMPKPVQTSVDASLMNQTGIAHTEPKVIELLEGWADANGKNLKDMKLDMKLTGDWSPCVTCTKRLRDFVATYGGTVEYCWTKGIYSSGIAREHDFVQGGGELMSGTVKHQGCVTITPTKTTFSGETLCKQGAKNGKKSDSTAK